MLSVVKAITAVSFMCHVTNMPCGVFSRFAFASGCRSIAFQLEAGMSTINDFATTYMCQSLPFGGVKESGFDRFGGRSSAAIN